MTAAQDRWNAGVIPYAEMGYYDASYEPKDTDILAAFRIAPQPGVDAEEAGAAVAGESSTATWTVVWTDRLTAHEHYQAKCYRVDPVPGREGEYIVYIAYDIDLFEEGSIPNLTSSIIGNVFGFKALRSLRLEDMRIPLHYVKTFRGPPHGIVMEREYLGKYGRPLLGATTKPKLGLSARNYGRVVYEALRGGLDFTKDDENINSQPFMRWRDRFLFAMDGVNRAVQRDRRDQGPLPERHRRVDGGHVRAGRVREGTRQRHRHGRPDRRLHGAALDVELGPGQRGSAAPAPGWPRDLHAAEVARRELPRDRQVVPADRRRSHPRRDGGRQAGGRPGHGARLLRHAARIADTAGSRPRASTSTRTGDRCPVPCRWPPAASTPGQMHQLLGYLGEDVVLQFGGGTIGHPMGIAAGATANRVAVEAMIKARNEGRDFLREGEDILAAAAKHCRELQAAIDTWGDITFNYESTDTPDVIPRRPPDGKLGRPSPRRRG